MSNVLKYKLLSSNAFPLKKRSNNSTGYDLFSAYDYIIPPYGKQILKTDIAVKIPESCYGRVAPLFSLTWEHFIDIGDGVINADFRGNVCVVMFNFGKNEFVVQRGKRIAQLICQCIADANLEEVLFLEETKRNDKGFGSTN